MHISTSAGQGTAPSIQRAFYTVADRRYFLGAVALLNSLRLVGHDDPLFLVDAGLAPEQRLLIASHVTLIEAPAGVAPVFLTPLGPLQNPADVAILLDADIIVTRPLTDLIEAARGGRFVAFQDPIRDRSFPDWSVALGLGPVRRQAYVNAGALFFPNALGERLLPLWIEGQAKVGLRQTRYGKGRLSDPFYFADQDVLNAIAAASLEPEEVMSLDHRLAPHPPFAGLDLVDRDGLVCRYADGTQPYALHHVLAKPWLQATPTNIYSLLLPRLLLAPDVALRLEPSQLPLRLRRGTLAAADRARANGQALFYMHARKQLGRFGIRTRLAAWRGRRRRADHVSDEQSIASER